MSVKGHFIVGAVFLVLTNLLALRIPKEIGGAIDHLRSAASLDMIDVPLVEGIAWTIALLAAGSAVARILSRIFVFNGARIIEYAVRGELFEHLTGMDQAKLMQSSTGDLVSRITNDVTYVRLLYGIGVLHLVNTSVAYVIVLGLMFGVSWELTLYALVPYPLILLGMRMFTRALYTRTQHAQAALSDISARAQENLSGMAVIKAFSCQEQEIEAFQRVSDDYLERNLSLARVRGALIPYMGSISGIGTLLVLWVGGLAVIEGTLTLGQYVEFSSYIVILAFPTIGLGWALSVWQRGLAAFDRLLEVQTSLPDITEPAKADALPLETASGEVEMGDIVLSDVSLTYADGTDALRGVNLTIKQGTTVAIVGRTGAGKSSLVRLLTRQWDPTEGEVSFGGRALPRLPMRGLRRHIGYVPQDPFLFSMTVRENVLLGVHDRPEGGMTLDEALDFAGMSGDIETLHEGLETMVGERGITLSGGQKQRLTIARAILRSPRLLLLDDALSSVDTATERRILEALRQIMKGRTSVLITHRYNALEMVDDIIVLDKGAVVEQGSHEALLAQNGLYCSLYRQQMAEAEVGA